MQDTQHYYLGIDLGTTNSCVHWGVLNPNTKLIEPRELMFDQQVADGGMQRRALLPSFIYFRQGDPAPIVGEYARRHGLQRQPSRVVRSVKNHMGDRTWRFEVDGQRYTPAELSATLLQTMFRGIRNTWGVPISDVVVTVPASFDGDMREDTMEAVRRAGFKSDDIAGKPRNLLLDEPRASLYDLMGQQQAGSIPQAVIDLSKEKTVMVFDLGGGTLDVSLHRVKQPSDVMEMQVEDLAISRYTQLGGDAFDRLIADELQRRFQERHKLRLADLSPEHQRDVRFQLEMEAEEAKRRLTTDIEQRLSLGLEAVPDGFSVDIQNPYLFDNKGLITQLTKGDLNEAIKPLLGEELTLQDVSRLEAREPIDLSNIIYPILDVLWKAEKKVGKPVSVDAVLLSGGMTRLHAVRERLTRLFGFRPLTVLDPDRSVSRGASIYHYLLHRGYRPKQILAESIGVEVHGGRIHSLIPAGTVLPTSQIFGNLFELPFDGASVIRFPLYRGEGVLPDLPNRRIAERRLVLKNPQPAGTQMDVEVSIDENKVVRFLARVHDRPQEQIVVEVGAEGVEPARPTLAIKTTEVTLPTGARVNVQELIEAIEEADAYFDVQGFKQIEPRVFVASNTADVVDALVRVLPRLKRVGKERVLYILGELALRAPNHPRMSQMVQTCIQHMQPGRLREDKYVTTVGRSAVVALGKMGLPVAESPLINALGLPTVDPIRDSILYSLGKTGVTVNALRHAERFIGSERNGERIAALWAVGKLGSREKTNPLPIAELTDLLTQLFARTDPRREAHATARKHAVYALGEIGDRRPHAEGVEVISDDMADLICRALQLVPTRRPAHENEEERQTRLFAGIALRMVQGLTLTAEEQGVLMAVRSLMAVSG